MNNKGLTLSEILISILIISIIAAGVFSTFVGSKIFFIRARHRLQAFNFAREFQDRLRSNYTYMDREMGAFAERRAFLIDRGELADLDGVITYSVSNSEDGGYKIVNVIVNWDEPEL